MSTEAEIRPATPDDVPELDRVMIATEPGGAVQVGVQDRWRPVARGPCRREIVKAGFL